MIEGNLAGAVLVVGQLGLLGSPQVVVTASGVPPLSLDSQHGWDPGLQAFDGALDWDSGSSLLSPAAGNTTESGFAYFQVGNTSRIDLVYTSSAATPLGDRVVVGIGVIPEPAGTTLLLLAAPLLFRRRRR